VCVAVLGFCGAKRKQGDHVLLTAALVYWLI
jgi:hypothetical protein